jgi:hypothetical protein
MAIFRTRIIKSSIKISPKTMEELELKNNDIIDVSVEKVEQ